MSFYKTVISADPRFHTIHRISDLGLLEPVTRLAVINIVKDAGTMGIQLVVTETYRSCERQQYLYDLRQTQLRHVGVHHYGLAADFCKIVNAKAVWEGDWKFLSDLAHKHGLISGYDWGEPGKPHTFCDYDHVQRVTLDQQSALFAGLWYPDSGLDSSIKSA